MMRWRLGAFLMLAFHPLGFISWADVYYVSGSVDETQIIKPESSVWRWEEEFDSSKKIYSSGAALDNSGKGFEKFEFWAEKNALVGWITIYDGSGKGELLWLPLTEPQKVENISLPIAPVSAGYLLQETKKIVVEGEGTSIVYDVKEKKMQFFKNVCDVPRDNLYLTGDSYQTQKNHSLFTEIKTDGEFFYGTALAKCLSSFVIKGEAQKFIEKINTKLSGVSINNENALVVTSAGVGNFMGRTCFLIYNKKKKLWSTFCAKTFAYPKIYKQWLMFQLVSAEENKISQSKKGEFQFYNINDNYSFGTMLGDDSEVLDLDADGWLLYRAGDALYKTQIQKDHLSEPIKLTSNENIKNVHWAMWVKKSSSSFVWQYLLFSIFMLIATILIISSRRKASDGRR